MGLSLAHKNHMADLPAPKTGFIAVHFITVSDIKRSTQFYRDILGGKVELEGEPTYVRLANTYVVLNVGGGPTDDKPDTVLRPPTNIKEISSFLNLRVSNIQHYYNEWKSKGAEFLTEPKSHEFEFRCYMKDPDGYLIEVGETKDLLKKTA